MNISVRKTVGGAIIAFLFADIFFFHFLSASRQWIYRGTLRVSDSHTEIVALQKENSELRSRVAEYERREGIINIGDSFIAAPLFSSYPWNDRSLVMIGAGTRDGISDGDPLVIMLGGSHMVFGQVTSTGFRASRARTIFDPHWNIAVRVGDKRVNALVVGGSTPRVTLMAKGSGVSLGDAVYAVANGLPYGMKIGTLGAVVLSKDGFFEEADLELPYAIGDIETVFIVHAYANN